MSCLNCLFFTAVMFAAIMNICAFSVDWWWHSYWNSASLFGYRLAIQGGSNNRRTDSIYFSWKTICDNKNCHETCAPGYAANCDTRPAVGKCGTYTPKNMCDQLDNALCVSEFTSACILRSVWGNTAGCDQMSGRIDHPCGMVSGCAAMMGVAMIISIFAWVMSIGFMFNTKKGKGQSKQKCLVTLIIILLVAQAVFGIIAFGMGFAWMGTLTAGTGKRGAYICLTGFLLSLIGIGLGFPVLCQKNDASVEANEANEANDGSLSS